jgi:UDP-N-acetylmuramate: L-alanyl-gamma-D-glutamyl-meso-diaminopimelate ligase
MPGEHNRSNALAAIAAARHVGVAPQDAIAAIARFSGVKRRLELRGEVAGVRVYDDFAHHPTAIAASIAALKGRAAQGERIVAVFEPRSNTMKQGTLRAALAPSLADADVVYTYSGGVQWNVADALSSLGARYNDFRELDALLNSLAQILKSGDHVLIMSNGGFGGVHARLLERLQSRGN